MFRYADIGRMWVPVDLPVGEGEGGTRIWLLQTLYTREELRQRDRARVEKSATALDTRAAADEAAQRPVSSSEYLRALLDELHAMEDADIRDLIERTHDWRDVVDAEGAPAVFSRERFEALLQINWVAQASRVALFAASREGVRKNSSPGPGGSPGHPQA